MVDVNYKTLLGNNPLHVAANDGHNDLVEALLSKGADPEIKKRY
ncbi:MAG: ankyrin repeat protein [Lentimonas sp.]|jgi:ankyrin repeat protein